jgi:hypothetical protein
MSRKRQHVVVGPFLPQQGLGRSVVANFIITPRHYVTKPKSDGESNRILKPYRTLDNVIADDVITCIAVTGGKTTEKA